MAITKTSPEQNLARNRAARRPALIALIVATWIVLTAAIFYGIWLTTWAYAGKLGDFSFTASVASSLNPGMPSSFVNEQNFDSVMVTAFEPLVLPRLLSAVATALPFLIMITGCIGTIVLAGRLLTDRPFTRAGQAVVTALGGLAVASSVLIRWCEARAAELAIIELGLPLQPQVVGETFSEPWVAPPTFEPLQDLDWPLLALGTTLLLVALLWRQAARLQRDTDGLI